MRHYTGPKSVTLTCKLCNTTHENVSVQADEDGPFAELEVSPCHDDECTKRLCGACPQFTCDCCGLSFCMDHIGHEEEPECTCEHIDVDLDDARDCDLHGTRLPKVRYYCRVCAAPEEMEVPQRIGPDSTPSRKEAA